MKEKQSRNGTIAGLLLPMGLLCLFAGCSLVLALWGGQAYKAIETTVDSGNSSTLATSYLRTKLANTAYGDSVLLREENGVQVLVLQSSISDILYETRIYMQDGELVESFGTADSDFAQANTSIAQLQSCTFAIAGDGLFTAEVVSENGTVSRTAFVLQEGGRI